VFIALAGLVYSGMPLPRAFLAERRPELRRGGGAVTPALAGVAFAIGWTPCVGPTLAAILALAVPRSAHGTAVPATRAGRKRSPLRLSQPPAAADALPA